jgi:hypothetical protein
VSENGIICCYDVFAPLIPSLPSTFLSKMYPHVGGLVFPGSFMHKKDKDGKAVMAGEPRDLFTEANFRKFERSWDDGRIQTAFFRGEVSLNCYDSFAFVGK